VNDVRCCRFSGQGEKLSLFEMNDPMTKTLDDIAIIWTVVVLVFT